jgi:site-specific DNA-cytosine methylase
MTLTVGSLFSGIGGMDLGLERAGHTVIWQSEIDPYCNKVLKKHWPTVPNLGDITTIDWGKIERPDIICGGYPCQPFSTQANETEQQTLDTCGLQCTTPFANYDPIRTHGKRTGSFVYGVWRRTRRLGRNRV